jgi:hypothetical protein
MGAFSWGVKWLALEANLSPPPRVDIKVWSYAFTPVFASMDCYLIKRVYDEREIVRRFYFGCCEGHNWGS